MVWLRRSPHYRPSSLSFRCRPRLVPGFLYHIEQARADSIITRRQFGRSTPTPVSGPTRTGALLPVTVLTADIVRSRDQHLRFWLSFASTIGTAQVGADHPPIGQRHRQCVGVPLTPVASIPT